MNSRKFAQSWGRKMFFGFSWPLTSLLAVIYLRSFIFPSNTTDSTYFVTTFIGHFGLLNVLTYFFLYCPVVFLMPSYYIVRFWSLILILGLNLLVLMDAVSFSNYHLHIYSYLSKLYFEEGFHHLLGSSTGSVILTFGVLAISIVIWVRGEMIWRNMQGRFSNPVKNWYLAIIFLCFIISQSIYHYGNIHPKLSDVFPLNQNISKQIDLKHGDNRKFFYPKDLLGCTGKNNPNIVMVVAKEWSSNEFTQEAMPEIFHMKRHSISFNSHYGAGTDARSGLFSLLYSIPASYITSIGEKSPALISELEQRKYEIVSLGQNEDFEISENNTETIQKFRNWIANKTEVERKPYFLSIMLSGSLSEIDTYMKELVLALEGKKLLEKSYFIVTGAYSGEQSPLIPYLLIAPDRRPSEVNAISSQYDIFPSLMQRIWNCKKAFKMASIGQPMEKSEKEWLLITGQEDTFKIIDFKNKNISLIKNGNISDSSISGTNYPVRHELIFSALKAMTSFSKPR